MSTFSEGYSRLTEEQQALLQEGRDYRGSIHGRSRHKHDFISGNIPVIADHIAREHKMPFFDESPERRALISEHLAAWVAGFSWDELFSMQNLDQVIPQPASQISQ